VFCLLWVWAWGGHTRWVCPRCHPYPGLEGKPLRVRVISTSLIKASFVSIGLIPTRMNKYNKKIMIATIRDPDLFRVEN
jgi:hypothetical protein